MDLFGCLIASGERPWKGFLLTCLGASLAAGVGLVGHLCRVSCGPVWVLACKRREAVEGFPFDLFGR